MRRYDHEVQLMSWQYYCQRYLRYARQHRTHAVWLAERNGQNERYREWLSNARQAVALARDARERAFPPKNFTKLTKRQERRLAERRERAD